MTLSGSLRGFVQPAALLRPMSPPAYLTEAPQASAQATEGEWITLGGAYVKLLDFDAALNTILHRAVSRSSGPLAVASANLDHIKHFGTGGRWADVLDRRAPMEWLTLLDGAPLVSQAGKITGRDWPRLAGSDLIRPLLQAAEARGLSVGFLGGTEEVHGVLRSKLAASNPKLTISGCWAPERGMLSDPRASADLAAGIAAARTDILVVCLGKPRQELWMSEYGHLTGANVMLAFGAVVDFLAGRVRRAPELAQNLGMEWAWRLALEPRRLAKRYLIEGPEAYLKLRNHSAPGRPHVPRAEQHPFREDQPSRNEGFSPLAEETDVAVIVVTYNNERDIPPLLDTLKPETREQSIKVIVADNSPEPSTLRVLRNYPGIYAFPTGGNLGYSGAINVAMKKAGSARSFLILNPDTRVEPGAIGSMRRRMAASGAGVVVPLLKDDDGTVYHSLRREPSVTRAIGDALMGSRLSGRPGWLAEMDFDNESYLHPHKVDWATGAALLVRPDVAELVGEWDEEYFLYSEETDFMHRVRGAGLEVWFDPRACILHAKGGSGSSAALEALMAANRIRYVRKFHAAGYARAFRAAVVLSVLLRSHLPRRNHVLAAVMREGTWTDLPHAESYGRTATAQIPCGAVIIPAHNEAAVLGRTLDALTEAVASGSVEVIVACNGCTDETAMVARSYPGVRVLEVAEASKVAALNAGDQAATRWPRLYLDADIELPLETLCAVLELLSGDQAVLCARPAFQYDTTGASWPVRAYYRARSRMAQASASMWGAGIYGLSEPGHARLGKFPPVTADDCYIDRLFSGEEKTVVRCRPVTVRTPRTARALVTTLRRIYRGNAELRALPGSHTGRSARELAMSVRGLLTALDAGVYAAFAVAGRRGGQAPASTGFRWERDESSRSGSGQ
ncbi:WecB/TagA/CpsF family glycosyltransferase [Pseudarthrobacter phenanthrenivorans]|nr:WecB/TagA/CpsF family glycosyltransferase [Pseudarthrobacter phenanthrenivorans]